MLNEIYKGMDNAAEQINENFQNGSIVESGINENGIWTRYGDGTQICRGKISLGTSTPNHTYAKPFVELDYINVTTSGTASAGSNIYVVEQNPYTTLETFQAKVLVLGVRGTTEVPRVDGFYIAVGRWK